MNRKKEPCRNFLRGSCQYGDRCKFLHANQQQSQPNNPFGFGSLASNQQQSKPNNPFGFGSLASNTNQQQQKPNPFGFGTLSNSQSNAQSDFGSKNQNQFKPFENKWSRPTASTNPTPPRKDDKQTQTANHKCTDPELCKRLITEDLQQERPLWKLTCYGHCKDRPCDIVGDISYEEVRAAAYDDAKRGLPLPSIVERERNLLNSKILEFENLLRNPYVISNTVTAGPSPFSTTNLSAPFNVQTNVPPTVSSFSQLATSLGPNRSNPAPPNMTFGQPSVLQNPNQNMGAFGNTNPIFGNQAASGGQKSMQPFGSGNIISNFNSSSTVPFAPPLQFPSSPSNNQSPFTSNPSTSPVPSMLGQAFMKTGGASADSCIWLKEQWTRGEIPEEAPPAEYIY